MRTEGFLEEVVLKDVSVCDVEVKLGSGMSQHLHTHFICSLDSCRTPTLSQEQSPNVEITV